MSDDDRTRTGDPPDIDVQALDADAVRALYAVLGEDRETLTEIVDAFIDEAPSRLAELRRATDEGDAPLARRAAHTLKSNGLTFGATELASQCRRLEDAARANELAGHEALVDRIEAQWTLVRRELTELRDGGPP